MSPAAIASLVGAFLLGAIPFSQLIARLRGVDLRRVGSGNIGATNLARSFGYGIGAFGLALDAAKGAAGAMIPRLVLGPDCPPLIEALAGGLAVVGHIFTPFLRFRGGKGVATGAGAFAVLSPGAALISVVVFVAALAITRIVGLASVLAALALPFAAHYLSAPRPITVTAGVVSLLVIARHRANLSRLLSGRESRLGAGGPM